MRTPGEKRPSRGAGTAGGLVKLYCCVGIDGGTGRNPLHPAGAWAYPGQRIRFISAYWLKASRAPYTKRATAMVVPYLGGIGLRRGLVTHAVAPGHYPEHRRRRRIEPAMGYRVLVDDNYHYMDQGQRYTQEDVMYAEALSVCQRIVEECLKEGYKPGITASALYGYYTMFGDDPFIVGDRTCQTRRPASRLGTARRHGANRVLGARDVTSSITAVGETTTNGVPVRRGRRDLDARVDSPGALTGCGPVMHDQRDLRMAPADRPNHEEGDSRPAE